jgi:hypothetical protein
MRSQAWNQWLSLNGNNLAWIVLTVSGVLCISILMRS